jgi:hypothetical protein
MTHDSCAARIGRDQRREYANRCGFACTVGAEQTIHRSLLDSQIYTIQRARGAE